MKVYGTAHRGILRVVETWAEVKAIKAATPATVFRKFENQVALDIWAENIWRNCLKKAPTAEDDVAFVDGSYLHGVPRWGVWIPKYDIRLKGAVTEHLFTLHRQEGGELWAAMEAVAWGILHSKSMIIVHDYEGVASYVTGTWDTRSEMAKAYRNSMRMAKGALKGFWWTPGHQKDTGFITAGNQIADQLAGDVA